MSSEEDLTGNNDTPFLKGDRIYLRKDCLEDLLFTYQWFLDSDPTSMTCRPYEDITPEEKLSRAREAKPTGKIHNFIILTNIDNIPVGKISYFDLNMANKSAEIGCLISPEYRLKGYASDGLKLLISYLFEELDLNKVYAQTGEFNTGSKALMKSLNFSLDGVLREHHFYNGRLHNDLVFSLLKKECNFL